MRLILLEENLRFIELYNRYYSDVFRLARRLLRALPDASEEAADVAQLVFIRLSSHVDKVYEGNPQGWLSKVTRNLCIDAFRKRRRSKEHYHTDDMDKVPTSVANTLDTSNDFEDLIEKLPQAMQETCRLRAQGYKKIDIAEIQKIPVGTVMSRLFRAQKILKNLMPTQD